MNDIWNGFYGQENVKEILNNIVESNKIPHAFLFSGKEGVGKDFCAIKFAYLIYSKLFKNDLEIDKKLKSISSFSEPYIKYIIPLPRGKSETDVNGPFDKLDNDDIQLYREELNTKISNPYHQIKLPKANNIKINSIRDIKNFLSMNYDDIPYRIILISDAHTMSDSAQNALLKNLEEPPEGVIFILTTPFKNQLRETIRSRCWNINFKPLSNNELKGILKQYYDSDDEVSDRLVPFADGSLSTAIKLLELDFDDLLNKTISILRFSLGRRYNTAYKLVSEIIDKEGTGAFTFLIQMIIFWLNDVQKYKLNYQEFYFSNHLDTIKKFSENFPSTDINSVAQSLEDLLLQQKNNANINILTLSLILKLARVSILK